MAISKKPRYNLSLILQETGLKADTIRAWERRYQLPVPSRSEGGHRLYSEYDLQTLQWLVARQKEGLRISQAAAYWMELVKSGVDPLQILPQPRMAETLVQLDENTDTLENLQQKWVDYCLAFDEHHAEQILSLAFAQFPIETVLSAVILPALKQVGELWYEGEATVQQEHFISEIAITKIQTLISAAPNPVHSQRILIACPPGEQHTIVLLVFTLMLRHRGWDVVYLGANVPRDRLNNLIEDIKPDLAVLNASRLSTAAELLGTLNLLLEHRIPAAFGGWIFTHITGLAQIMPATYLGDTLLESLTIIEGLLNDPGSIPLKKTRPLLNQDLVRKINTIRPDLDSAMLGYLPSTPKNFGTLDIFEANQQLVSDISAALTLGDIQYLRVNLNWLSGLLSIRNLEHNQLGSYLRAFKSALEDFLGSEANQIYSWLENPNIDP